MSQSDDDTTRFPGGLRTQLLASLALLLVGTLALVALAFIQLLERHVRSTEVEQTLRLTSQLADVSAPEGASDIDEPKLRRTVDSLMSHHPHIVGASLEVSASNPDSGSSDSATVYRHGELPSIEQTDDRTYRIANRGGRRLLVTHVHSQHGYRASIARSLEPAFQRVQRMRDLLIAYLALDALFVLIVGYALLTFLVVRPIRAIDVATQRAARGDLASHIELQPRNEFGEVARSFNDMLDELRDNRQRLRERIDELDQAYTDLEETQQNLIRSEKLASVGRLAAGVAHEIGNPLSAVTGYLDMLDDEDLDAETRRDIQQRSQRQLERIRTIIRDLLDFSRQDTEGAVEPVDLAACIREAVDLVEPQPRARGIDIDVDFPSDLPRVRADSAQLTQVFVNLVMNAADAISDDHPDDRPADSDSPIGHILIRARTDASDADTLLIDVIDDGPGVPPDDQANIFDPFFTTKDPGDGTGLGLAVSLRIAERFDGDISVTSPAGHSDDPERGTTFTVTLPTCEDESAPQTD
jgi:signal transduction histidine kinase